MTGMCALAATINEVQKKVMFFEKSALFMCYAREKKKFIICMKARPFINVS